MSGLRYLAIMCLWGLLILFAYAAILMFADWVTS